MNETGVQGKEECRMADGSCKVHGMNHVPGATGLGQICWYDQNRAEKERLRKMMDDFLFSQFLTMELAGPFLGYGDGHVLLETNPTAIRTIRDIFFCRGARPASERLATMLSNGELRAILKSEIKITTTTTYTV